MKFFEEKHLLEYVAIYFQENEMIFFIKKFHNIFIKLFISKVIIHKYKI